MNPNALLEKILNSNQNNNPMAKNVIQMYLNGDVSGLQEMANNMCSAKGTTPQEVRSKIMNMFL